MYQPRLAANQQHRAHHRVSAVDVGRGECLGVTFGGPGTIHHGIRGHVGEYARDPQEVAGGEIELVVPGRTGQRRAATGDHLVPRRGSRSPDVAAEEPGRPDHQDTHGAPFSSVSRMRSNSAFARS